MTTVNYNLRLDKELRDQAFAVLDRYGLPPSQALKIFLKQIARTNSIPLSFDYENEQRNFVPNAETKQAILQAREEYATGSLTRYKNADEAMQAMAEIARD